MSLVWLDGELVDKADAKVGVADHGLLFGDGVTADLRAYGGRVFRLPQHLERLQAAAASVGLTLPVAGDELAAAINATLKANSRTDGFVKVVVTRGAGPITLDPRKCSPVTLILAEEAVPVPRELYADGLDVVTVPVPWAPPADLLSAGLRAAAKGTALRAGCLEALLVLPDGTVASGSETDVAVVGPVSVKFAPGGVTHDAAAELVNGAERLPVHRADLATAREVILTSAAAEVVAVRSIDGKPVGDGAEGPVARRLRQEFAAMTRGDNRL